MNLLHILRRRIVACLCLLTLGLMPASMAQAFDLSPYVLSVLVPANGTYTAGQVLAFTINSSEQVEITDNPRLALTIGSQNRFADYISSDGFNVTFMYTVQKGDLDEDGITINSVDHCDGYISNISGSRMDPTLNSVPDTTNILIDGGQSPATVPTLTEWAMILLALALAGMAALKLLGRRRQSAV